MKTIFRSMFLLLVAFPVFAQEPAPSPQFTEQVDVNLVLVDATVTDSKGRQILGLDKNDFIVKEDGVPQEIQSIDYFTNRRLLDAPESKAAFKVERVREERYFILFFDKILGAPSTLGLHSELFRAKKSAETFIDEQLQPQDKVAILGHDSRLKIYADFTSDKKILRKALNEATNFSNGILDTPDYAGEPSLLKHLDKKEVMNHTGRVYDAIRVAAEAMPDLKARKVLILFSIGIGDSDPVTPQFLENDDRYYQPMLHALNEANVTVYSVNLLRKATTFYPQENPLSRMATETGGQYFRNFVSFSTPLKAIEKENNGYYMLSYSSKHPKGEHGYQKIDVSLKNTEFRLRAREGYAY